MAVQNMPVMKWHRVGGASGTVANVAGTDVAMFQYDGSYAGGATPTGWANPTNATLGALGQDDPAGGLQRWLMVVDLHGLNAAGLFTIWDRLGHMGGMSGTSLAVQNVNGGADATITRTYFDPNGNAHINNEIWIEDYVTIGTTVQPITVVYKNENGVQHTTTGQIGGSLSGYARLAQTRSKVPLASGDRGVSALVSAQLGGSTGTAGNFGVSILHPLLTLSVGQYSPEFWSGALEGPIEILPGACIDFSALPTGNFTQTLPALNANFVFVDK